MIKTAFQNTWKQLVHMYIAACSLAFILFKYDFQENCSVLAIKVEESIGKLSKDNQTIIVISKSEKPVLNNQLLLQELQVHLQG